MNPHSTIPLSTIPSPSLDQLSSPGGTPLVVPEYPELRLLRQTSTTQETISKNGLQKNVHVVVKNTPFVIELCLTQSLIVNNQVVDLRQLGLDVQLLYDCDGLKPVNYVRAKPCEYKLAVNERGDQASLTTRIKVLTSQHEDMLFRVRVFLIEPKSKREFDPTFDMVSEPIKVISKPKQTRKRKRAPAQKRTLHDILVETVQRIEEHQKRQQQSLERIVANKDNVGLNIGHEDQIVPTNTTTTSWDTSSNFMAVDLNTQNKTGSIAPEDDFGLAFYNFITSYNQITPEEKPSKIRKVMRNCSAREGEQLSELFDVLLTQPVKLEGERKTFFGMTGEEGTCSCTHCPHRLELAKIDQFYTDFLATEGNAATFGGQAMEVQYQ